MPRPGWTTPSTASRPAPPRATGCAPRTRRGGAPFASQATISAEGQHTVEYRSADNAGNVETAKRSIRHRHPGPGLPGHPGLRRPDLRHRAAAGPLLRHRVRPRRRAAQLQVGVRRRRLLRPRGRAHVHPAGDVHGKVTATDDEGDKTSQEVTVTVRAPGVEPPTASAERHHPAGGLKCAVQRRRAPIRTARRTTSRTRGTSMTAEARIFQNPTHKYVLPGTYNVKVTVTDGSRRDRDQDARDHGHRPAREPEPDFEVAADWNSGPPRWPSSSRSHGGDPDGDALAFEWDFDDGSTFGGPRAQAHVHQQAGPTTSCSRSATARAARRP